MKYVYDVMRFEEIKQERECVCTVYIEVFQATEKTKRTGSWGW